MNRIKPRLDKPDSARLACLSFTRNWPSTISRVSFALSRNWPRIQCWRSVRGSLLSRSGGDEVDGFPVHVQILEHERRFAVPFEQVNR